MTLAPPRPPQTRSGLLPEARELVLPAGIKTSGFPAIRETCRQIGIEFDRWQQDLNKCLLAKDAAGLYAADTAVLSIPRQVGKTYDVGAVAFALCIGQPGLTVVWTAHRFKVSRESFNEMRSWAKRRELGPHIDYDAITTAAGNECIPFRNGSRIVFAARERGAIRGFTKVGMLVLDEAQILTETAMSDLIPTTNQAPNPLIILMGTPPKPTDPGEVFTRLRAEALTGESQDVLYVELSADAGADPDDRKQWHKANPSYPTRTPARSILRMRKLLSLEDFLREGLGIWDETAGTPLFGAGMWDANTTGPRPGGLRVGALAVAVSYELTHGAVGAAGVDGNVTYVKPLQHGRGTHWVAAEAKQLQDRHNVDVVIDGRGPAAVLITDLQDAGVRLKIADTMDVLDAFAEMFDKVLEHQFAHESFPVLDAAVNAAVKRSVGDRFALGRKTSSADISTLETVMLAAWWADKKPTPPPAEPRTLYHDGMSSTADLAEIGF